MAELTTVARPYAEAVFATACENVGDLEKWSIALESMSAVSQVKDLQDAIQNPCFSKEEGSKLFLSLLNIELNDSMKCFVELLFENNRFELLPEISQQFQQLKDRHQGMACAEIVTAFPLDEVQLKELLTILEKKFGHQLRPRLKTDKSLIGGIRVTVGDQVMDISVQAQLAQLRTQLTS